MKSSILIFGGGELQLSLIETAKSLGFFTIVIDPDSNAVAASVCDLFISVAGDDFDTTLDIAVKYDVKGIITAATDHPILMMSKISEKLNLSFPSHKSCFTLLDKGAFKEFLMSNNISHARGGVYNTKVETENLDLKYPLIVKPLRNSGSRGVIKCLQSKKLEESIVECLKFCKDNKFIVEEFIEGEEISVEAFVSNQKVTVVQITDKEITQSPYNVELGHVQPSKYLNRIEEITKLLQKIVDLSGIDNCMLHPELKLDEQDITIIEIGPRLGGDFISSKLVPLSTGVSLEEILIKIATRRDFSITREEKFSAIYYLNLPPNSIINGEITEEELKEVFAEVIEFKYKLKIGDKVEKITNSLNRYGHFIIQTDSEKNVQALKKDIITFITTKLLKKIC